MPEGNGVVAERHLRLAVTGGVEPLLCVLLHLQGHHIGRRFAGLESPEIPLRQGLRLGEVEVAHQRAGQVPRRVVGVIELFRLFQREHPEVGGPADDRPGIGMRLPEQRVEGFVELSGGRGFGAEPPLLVHHIALGVELAEHRPQQALRLHPEPQLEPVLRHRDEVHGLVVRGEGVHAGGAGLGIDAVELVLHHERPLFLGQGVELVPERRQLLGQVFVPEGVPDEPQPALLPALPVDGSDPFLDLLLFPDDRLVPFRVGGPDAGRALEHHVLEEVAHPGDARPLVRRAHMRRPPGRNGRHLRPYHREKLHPVVERELLHRNGRLRPALRRQAEKQGEKRRGEQARREKARAKGRPGRGSPGSAVSHAGMLPTAPLSARRAGIARGPARNGPAPARRRARRNAPPRCYDSGFPAAAPEFSPVPGAAARGSGS